MTKGRSYHCDGCAACCVHFSVSTTVEDRRREPLVGAAAGRLPLVLAAETDGWTMPNGYLNHDSHGGCPLLTEAGQCSVHQNKPDVCRLFRPGSVQCQWARGRSGLAPLYTEVG